MKKYTFFLLTSLLLVTGCSFFSSGTGLREKHRTEVTATDGSKKVAEHEVELKGYDTAKLPGYSVDLNGGAKQSSEEGQAKGLVDKVNQALGLLNPVMIIGALMIPAGILLMYLTPAKKAGLYMAIAGAATVASMFLLAQYSGIIMLLLILAGAGFGAYFLWKIQKEGGSTTNLVRMVEYMRSKLPAEEDAKIFGDDRNGVKKGEGLADVRFLDSYTKQAVTQAKAKLRKEGRLNAF